MKIEIGKVVGFTFGKSISYIGIVRAILPDGIVEIVRLTTQKIYKVRPKDVYETDLTNAKIIS